jgi:hypothetical protein
MTTITCSHADMTRCDQGERKASSNLPALLSVIEQASDQWHAHSPAADLASQVTRLVEERVPVTILSPLCWAEQESLEHTFTDQVYSTVKRCFQRGFRRLLLVPWGGRQNMGSLVEPVRRALSAVTEGAISQTQRALPQVHVDGVSARSGFEGMRSIHDQLGPPLEAFPGWDRTWIRLWTGQVKIVLLRSGAWMVPPSRTAVWQGPTRKALTAALCPQQAGFMTTNEHSSWQQDGQIYVRYLVSLLVAATQFLQEDQV